MVRCLLRAPVVPCATVRHDLCRLAVGAGERLDLESLARHAHGCAACRTCADEVLSVRAWLAESARAVFRVADGAAPVGERAAEALRRELAARLARDLLALARTGRVERPRAEWRADLLRLVALDGRAALAQPPWPQVRAALRGGAGRPARRRLLQLAARLDPLGLDIALGWLSALERSGRGSAADREADRLLRLLG